MRKRPSSGTTIVRTIQVYTEAPLLDVDELSEATGFHRDLIRELEHAGMIPAVARNRQGEPVFEREVLQRCRLIARLHQRESMSFHLIRQWLAVLQRLENAESELDQYRRL
ncbi:MAG: MerR family transcriptional regulator [Verrucomicrobiales bacterium]|nr:MerR family transcriptional regulator [Verrucomicrobiales bacterium]